MWKILTEKIRVNNKKVKPFKKKITTEYENVGELKIKTENDKKKLTTNKLKQVLNLMNLLLERL